MVNSNNGWALDPMMAKVIAGQDYTMVRHGAVAIIFEYLGNEFDRRVEKIVTFNGYRSKTLNDQSGGIKTSNHRSATAVDINGYKHPYEAGRYQSNYNSGFSVAQKATIRLILADLQGTIKWGLDFPNGWRDAMHFEIQGGSTKIGMMALRISPVAIKPDIPIPIGALLRSNFLQKGFDVREIIEALYLKNCKRPASEEEILTQTNLFAMTGGNLAEIWRVIANSDEAKKVRAANG